jgi:hypothetical protein
VEITCLWNGGMLSRLFNAIRRLFLKVREARAARESELQRVDDPEELRRELQVRNRRLLAWIGALSLGGLLVGLMIGRIYHGDVRPREPIIPQVRLVHAAEGVDEASGKPAYRLVLSLNRPLRYERYHPDGALNLRLPNIGLAGGSQSGQVKMKDSGSFSWSVTQQGKDVNVLVVGLGRALVTQDHLDKKEDDTWELVIEIQ